VTLGEHLHGLLVAGEDGRALQLRRAPLEDTFDRREEYGRDVVPG